jgi:hypothetical protein
MERAERLYDQALDLIIRLQHCDTPQSRHQRLWNKAQARLVRRGDALQRYIDQDLYTRKGQP